MHRFREVEVYYGHGFHPDSRTWDTLTVRVPHGHSLPFARKVALDRARDELRSLGVTPDFVGVYHVSDPELDHIWTDIGGEGGG